MITMRANMHIFSLLAAALLLFGCGEKGGRDEQTPIVLNVVTVNGGVYDRQTGDPVRGVTLVLSSYDEDDAEKQSALSSDMTSSLSSGEYSLVKTSPQQTRRWAVSAIDTMADRPGGTYSTLTIDININESSRSYDFYSKSYKVEHVDFYLSRSL